MFFPLFLLEINIPFHSRTWAKSCWRLQQQHEEKELMFSRFLCAHIQSYSTRQYQKIAILHGNF